MRSHETEVPPGDIQQDRVFDAVRVGATAVDDLPGDKGGKIDIAEMAEQLHRRNGDGLRADRPIPAAEIDRLQINLLDLTIAGLKRALMEMIHGSRVERRKHHRAGLKLESQRLLDRLAPQRDRRILGLGQAQDRGKVDRVLFPRHGDDLLPRQPRQLVPNAGGLLQRPRFLWCGNATWRSQVIKGWARRGISRGRRRRREKVDDHKPPPSRFNL